MKSPRWHRLDEDGDTSVMELGPGRYGAPPAGVLVRTFARGGIHNTVVGVALTFLPGATLVSFQAAAAPEGETT